MEIIDLLKDKDKAEEIAWKMIDSGKKLNENDEKILENLLPFINSPNLLYEIFEKTNIHFSNEKMKQMLSDPERAWAYMYNYKLEPCPEHWIGREIVLRDPETALYFITNYEIDIDNEQANKLIIEYLIENYYEFRNTDDSDIFYLKYSYAEHYFELLKKKNLLEKYLDEYGRDLYIVILHFFNPSFFPKKYQKKAQEIDEEINDEEINED
jgi:hypothetical protein